MPIYEIQLVTQNSEVWNSIGGQNSVPIPIQGNKYDFSTSSLSIIRVNDQAADGNFDIGDYGSGGGGKDQLLTEDTLLGRQDAGDDPSTYLYPAGTPIALAYEHALVTARPVDADGNPLKDASGNPIELQYIFSMPMNGNDYSERFGNGESFMVIPVGHSTPFDLTMQTTFKQIDQKIGGSPYPPQPIYDNAPCFSSDTLIDTPDGPVPICDLQAGDLVMTRDHGPQPIRWIGSRHLDALALDLRPNLRPIRIKAGALGPAQPCRDLTVSPQHRILVQSSIAARMFDSPEVLIAAKHLCLLDNIRVENPPEGVTYMHILLDRHEVVRSNGAWTESLFTGPQAMKAIPCAARREILSIFPDLVNDIMPQGARPLIEGRRSRQLAQRHHKNRKALVA